VVERRGVPGRSNEVTDDVAITIVSPSDSISRCTSRRIVLVHSSSDKAFGAAKEAFRSTRQPTFVASCVSAPDPVVVVGDDAKNMVGWSGRGERAEEEAREEEKDVEVAGEGVGTGDR